MIGLDEMALKDFNNFMTNVIIPGFLWIADKHHYDRDDFMMYVATIFSTMAEVSTFENYKLPYVMYGDTDSVKVIPKEEENKE